MTTDELIDRLALQTINYMHFARSAMNKRYMPEDMQSELFQQNAELLALAFGEIAFGEGWTEQETGELLKRKHDAMVQEIEKIEKRFAQSERPS